MAKTSLRKARWTMTFDPTLKNRIRQEARRLRVYPVQLLESLVREQLNPYGFRSVRDSIVYVNSIREQTSELSDRSFLAEMRKWQRG